MCFARWHYNYLRTFIYHGFPTINLCIYVLGSAYIQWPIFVATCDFHWFICRTLKWVQGTIPSLLAFSKNCHYIGAIYITTVTQCHIFFEEIITCLIRRKARLLSHVAITVTSSDECQTMKCKLNGEVLKSQDF